MRGIKPHSKKLDVKVEGEKLDGSSSGEEKTDHLSYSYSCVKSYRKNQHIIGNLAALNNQRLHGIDHQPALYSLSGERSRPICQPFYCNSGSDDSNSSEEESESCLKQQFAEEKDRFISNEGQQIPVKSMLLQWLKYQFKQVNSLWSFRIPKDIFLQKFCKKNKTMKMEMTLNVVDEETKHRLISYINKLNLGFEEHRNLCTSNETVLEIDVTSLLNDSNELQSFLTFLKSINSGKSEVSRRNNTFHLNERVDMKHSPGRNIAKEYRMKENPDYIVNRNTKSTKAQKNTYETYSVSATSTDHNESFLVKPKGDPSKIHNNNQSCIQEVKLTHPERKNIDLMRATSKKTGKKESTECNRNYTNIERKAVIPSKKRARQISTLCGTNYVNNVCIQPQNNSKTINNPAEFRNDHLEQVFHVDTSILNDKESKSLMKLKKELSCKCLMHHTREDYHRYKNMCLFGNGDEMNNSFIGYVTKREDKSELSLLTNETRKTFSSNSSYEIKDDKIFKAAKSYKIQKHETNFPNKPMNNIKEFFKNKRSNHEVIFNSDTGASLEESLFSSKLNMESLKEPVTLDENSSVTIDDCNLVEGKDNKGIVTNACYKSLSYCYDSFPKMNSSGESSTRRSDRGRTNIPLPTKYETCMFSHKESIVRRNVSQKTFELIDKKKDNENSGMEIFKNCFKGDRATGSGSGYHSSVNVDTLADSTIINRKFIENLKENKNMNKTNESHRFDLTKNILINTENADHKSLSSLINDKFEMNKRNIFNEAQGHTHTDTPFSYNDDNHLPCNQTSFNKGINCGNEKDDNRKSKVKTIVFRIGTKK